MKRHRLALLAVLTAALPLAIAAPASADEAGGAATAGSATAAAAAPAALRANTISIDPLLGAIGFSGRNVGDWAVSYERRLAPRHALLVEQATVHVHRDPWHLTTFGLGAGYRHYLRPSASAPFIGVLAGAKLGTGRYGDMPDNKLTARAVFATAHAGIRHTWSSGLTVAARLGAGLAHYAINDDAPMGAAEVKDARLAPLPFELDSELSVGFAF
jgi:hypothetical protein